MNQQQQQNSATSAASSSSSSSSSSPYELSASFVEAAEKRFYPLFRGEFDNEGVFFYQAFNDSIADFALKNQTFDKCPDFNASRMTWIKPSFGWLLYRSGYARKKNQHRALKVKLSHKSVASILSKCRVVDSNKATQQCSKAAAAASLSSSSSSSSGGGGGRVQWDPERDMLTTVDCKEPRAMTKVRAIQIGVSHELSEEYVKSILSVTDVTELAHAVGSAHSLKKEKQRKEAMEFLLPQLPKERAYFPALCSESVLMSLGLKEGPVAEIVAALGRGGITAAVPK